MKEGIKKRRRRRERSGVLLDCRSVFYLYLIVFIPLTLITESVLPIYPMFVNISYVHPTTTNKFHTQNNKTFKFTVISILVNMFFLFVITLL